MINNLGWESLQHQRYLTRVTMLFKISNGIVEVPAHPLVRGDSRTRGANRFFQIPAATNCYKTSFFPRTIRDWNLLPANITNCQTLECFRAEVSAFHPQHINSMMDVETIQLALEDGIGNSGETFLVTVQVTLEQESAMEAFFQINSWQLMKEVRSETIDHESVSLSVRVTAEQEAALYAFFQINNWDVNFVKESDTTSDSQPGFTEEEHEEYEQEVEGHQVEIQNIEQSGGTMVEEVSGLQMINVTTTDTDGKPQVITVFAEGGRTGDIPQSLLTELGGAGGGVTTVEGVSEDGGRDMPQVIIQEITLPEGMSLDQGLVIANPGMTVTKTVTPRGSVRPGDKIHKCNVCNKSFKQLQSFHGHYQSHFGAKPFKCDICNKGFTLKAALVSHQSIHTGVKPFVCSLCNKGFRRKDDMMSHLRTHTGEKPYECDICGKKFKYRNQIPKHRRAHTGERPYKCEHCEKTFTSNIHLSRHIRVHTGERPYKCEYCMKAFTQYGHLQAHTRIHTDERPYPCEVCGRRFREKKVMKRHELLHSTERKFKCEVCGRGFLRQSNLDLHAVMHQKGPKERGIPRGRPKPKKKAVDAEMRAFVANVLSSVKKVDSGMQTETAYVNGIPPDSEESAGADNLSAFVNFAVEQDNNKMVQVVEGLEGVQNDEGQSQQFTLVMEDDGSGGYLISNYDGNTSGAEIVTSMPSQQIEVSTGESNIIQGTVEVVGKRGDNQNVVDGTEPVANDNVVYVQAVAADDTSGKDD